MCQCVRDIKMQKDANAARAHGVLIVKILNKLLYAYKCLIYLLEYILIHRNISINRNCGCLREIEIQIVKKIKLANIALNLFELYCNSKHFLR